jgi:AbiV family abortive infection protein
MAERLTSKSFVLTIGAIPEARRRRLDGLAGLREVIPDVRFARINWSEWVQMSSPVTPQYLLEGAVYALEQCGLLLRDANILYRSGSYANTVVLAAFAREELGCFIILCDLRKEVLAGANITIEEIKRRCDDHVTKQQAGMLSTTIMVTDRESRLGKLLSDRMTAHPQSAVWKNASAALDKITKLMQKRLPTDRHKSRMAALYVDVEPVSGNKWNRPAETSPAAAQKFLNEAVGDYAVQYGQSYITSPDPILKHIDPELYSALEQWSGRPELPRPEWSHDTGS